MEEVRFWDRAWTGRAEAQAKHDAALKALNETQHSLDYLRGVITRAHGFAGIQRMAREKAASKAEEAISRAAWVGYWKLQLDKFDA